MSDIQSETERTAVEFDTDGSVKSIVVDDAGNMGDVQAGIEFIYHMREHLLDIGVATLYGIVVYALVLWIKRKLS
jgi:hypothetical protein|tara:strand:+ start:61 stop:285 length:225 start_codon:yes stop_codon:yes gene_type:complete